MGFKYFSEKDTVSPNPNPEKFFIGDMQEFGAGDCIITVARVHYPGCTVYQGIKILVFKCSPQELQNRSSLDPHFLENESSPIARFPATIQGNLDACAYAQWKCQR